MSTSLNLLRIGKEFQ